VRIRFWELAAADPTDVQLVAMLRRCDPATVDVVDASRLAKRVIAALTYLGHCDDAMKVIDEHRRTTTEVAEQMNDAYMLAMIYTRHLPPDRVDQDLALLDSAPAWMLVSPRERLVVGDHLLVVCDVLRATATPGARPLVHHNGGFHALPA
jgi:hypothetical protein